MSFGRIAAGVATGGLSEGVRAVGKWLGGGGYTPDIGKQVDLTKALAQKQKPLIGDTYSALKKKYGQYQEDIGGALQGMRENVTGTGQQYVQDLGNTTEAAKNSLRSSLYSNTFSGVPAAMQAVRETGAAGAGVGSGAYLKGVQGVGSELAQRLAQGEQEIQTKGLETMAGAQSKIYNTLSNLEGKIGEANLNLLTKVMDTGREDDLRQLSLQMGLNDQETQGLIDLYNFQESGQLASKTAADANKTALLSSLISGGTKLASAVMGKPA